MDCKVGRRQGFYFIARLLCKRAFFLCTMSIPSFIEFGGGKTYSEVRSLQSSEDWDALYKALRYRLENYLITQVDRFALKEEKPDAYSAFPIFAIACIGIAALGEVFIRHVQQQPGATYNYRR